MAILEIVKEETEKEMRESIADDKANQAEYEKNTGPSKRCRMLRQPPKLRWRRSSSNGATRT